MFENATSVRISRADFNDIVAGRTGNPCAEQEIPQLLSEAINKGIPVLVTDEDGRVICRIYDF
jgi:hypothetical protein